jgi:hypothetical protein
MSQLGRISGPLLKANLIRDGVDLAFETDLLYLDVNNSRIGINTNSPSVELDVNGTTRTNDFQITNQLDVADLTLTGSTVSSSQSTITLAPFGSNAVVYQGKFIVDDIQITGNTISTEVSNSNLELRANGTGAINLQSNTNITGNLDVSGNISAVGNVVIGGNITIGDDITDTITINAGIQSDLIPSTDNTFDLGSPSLQWRDVYANNLYTNNLNITMLDIGNLMFRDNEIVSTTNQDIYIDGNGTGGVRLANFKFSDNTITNVISGAVSTVIQSGTGYFKIDSTAAFVPPVGTSVQRPTAYAVIGMTRYNTESKSLEVWDGLDWASPAGASGAVSEITANEIAAQFAIALG